ncbi:DUF748 domain-containing protein [Amphritea japonica]|uniref:DUF748 domain-containing protein n=1 Tax=Amphritea japonica ATCC BAA-1530 TaxID=1278309 RepID=A0A7R6PD62_9GAMM|nr:DUF748 domain-containing protein [Amphritea japonica]BBB27847.1 conserved hypothetical protein [Amphritea japonica ATCC BAA-1530]
MSVKGFLQGSIITLLAFFLLLHTSIQLGRDFAVQWLLDQGASSARIHSLSVNWFTGRVTLQGVSVITPDQPELKLGRLIVDLDYSSLLEQRILISDLILEEGRIDLREEVLAESSRFYIGPIALPAPAAEESSEPDEPSSLLFGLNRLSIADFSWQARLKEGDYQLSIDNGNLDTFYMWQEEAITNLSLNGAINGAPFSLDTKAQPLTAAKRSELHIKLDQLPIHSFSAPFVPELRATLTTDLKLTAMMGESITIAQSGSFRVDNFSWNQTDLDVSQQLLTWKGTTDVVLRSGKPESVALDGALKLAGLELSAEAMSVNVKAGNWQGSTGLAFNESGLDKVDVKGQLTADELIYQQPERMQASVANTDWQGAVSLLLQEQPLVINSDEGELSLSQVQVKALKDDQVLLTLADARLKAIKLALPKEVSVAGLKGSGLKVAPAADNTLAQLNMDITNTRFQLGKALMIERVSLQNLLVQEQLSGDKKPVNVERLQAGLNSLSETEVVRSPGDESEPSSESALRIQVSELLVNGESKVMFTDNSTEPAFNSEVQIIKAQLLGLDSGSKTPAKFDLGLKLNGFTTLDLTGDTNLAGGGEKASWKGQLKQLELPRLSPYSIQYTGYYLQNGQMALNSSGELSAGKIKGTNEIKIHRLEVEPADQEQMAKFSKKLSMPLGTAISVLQDGDDNIDLDVPISGSLEDPNFGLQSVVQRLAGKGLKKAAFSILTKSLEPYSTLISLVVDAATDGSFIRLDPVSFAPGSAELDAHGRGYLTKIESMLTERKGMRLNICGQAVQQDQLLLKVQLEEQNKKREKPLSVEKLLEQERASLIELAQQRADRVKQQLIKKVKGERLFTCFPVPSLADPKALPSVSLGL